MPTPLYNAEQLISAAVRTALAPIAGTYQERPRVYAGIAEQGAPLPVLVFQFQADIQPDWRLGSVGASALITVKALAEHAQAARDLLALAAPQMASLSADGVTLTSRYVRSPSIPVLDGIHTRAHIWRIRVERAP